MKKITKVLSVAASVLFVLAAVSCNNLITTNEVEIESPVLTVESRFGGNVLSWNEVNNAEYYRIYRSIVTKTTNEKGKEVEEVSEPVYVDVTRRNSTYTGTQYYKDIATDGITGSFNLAEGVTYRYYVVASAYSDRAAIYKGEFTVNEEFKAATSSTADVTIKEGMIPVKGSRVPAVEKFTYTVNETDGTKFINYVKEDYAYGDKATVTQKAFAVPDWAETANNYNAWNGLSIYDENGQYLDWKFMKFQLPCAISHNGTYKFYTELYSPNTNNWLNSLPTYAEETITLKNQFEDANDVMFSNENGRKFVEPSIKQEDGIVYITISEVKDYVDAGITVCVKRGVVDSTLSMSAGVAISDFKTLEITPTVIKGSDTTAYYLYKDDTVEVGKQYLYAIQLVKPEAKCASAEQFIAVKVSPYTKAMFDTTSYTNSVADLTWTVNKKAVAAKAVVTLNKYLKTDNGNISKDLGAVDISKAKVVYNEDGTVTYNFIDTDVKDDFEDGEYYMYTLTTTIGDWSDYVIANGEITKTVDNSTISADIVTLTDKDGIVTGHNIIIEKELTVEKGTKFAIKKETDNNESKVVEGTYADLTYTVISTNENNDKVENKVWFYYVDKEPARLDSTKEAKYIYTVKATAPDGKVTYYTAENSSYNKYYDMFTGTYIDANVKDYTKNSITAEVTLYRSASINADETLAALTVKAIVKYTDADGADKYLAPVTVTGLKDAEAKELTIKGLTADTEYVITLILEDTNGMKIASYGPISVTTLSE